MTDQLTELATQRLREVINHPKWKTGGRLPPEEKLARSIGLSRSALRRALVRLREEGLIVSKRGSGNYVLPSVNNDNNAFIELGIGNLSDVENCVRFRYGLEVAMCGEAAERATDEDIEAIIAANQHLAENQVDGSLFEADFQVHLSIAKATQNPYYRAAMESLRTPMQVCYEIGRRLRDIPLNEASHRVHNEHDQLIQAIKQRNPVAAKAAMDIHLSATLNRFLGKSET
ncbi:FadR/GntR family transcriptional regulator [Pseudocolwellia agarivorans]|uniref:FadR/GntR family transcriptional regulator n=1 Tax=Pseudocolwellia agarivorans TaxID=1911682 RepID=UPI000984C42C|nr:FadR/GntR family transcriptional regulator [Pseudocolwellia agarivorans]